MRLLAAVLVGALIGYERSYHGRPAGFRTHTLVCITSALLMLVTVYEHAWMPHVSDNVRMDPTRMAQGIMTGIGFLGAGVIFKEGLTVRGLTTAASVWVTAALGILIGIGFYFPAAVTAVLVLFTLSAFRWVESRMPMETYARLTLVFPRGSAVDAECVRRNLKAQGFTVAQMSYRLVDDGSKLEYRMMIRTTQERNMERLAHTLAENPALVAFRISPTGD